MDYERQWRRIMRLLYEDPKAEYPGGSEACWLARKARMFFVEDDGSRHCMPIAWFCCRVQRRHLIPWALRLRCRYGNVACVRPDHMEAVLSDAVPNAAPEVRQRILSDDDVRLIRTDPRSIPVLARLFQVNEKTIWRVRKRLSKAGVPDIPPGDTTPAS